eukprot:CAMPEP_0203915770 /NCGR_PEP_ID=MMETSP0359-20131031/56529_1 /ASSEMBLY_ACC=CAM_ASM_000338 /TAXON_ID=268821 /ORGANISM="Scrippsiella Hangoei, Strain SHTV-5" /LENGTH=621 /DNA_ID=CAMNT_0050842333 /DNA_START=114 /DNA_END=1976 /DNA_ORIENTATION=-
MPNLLDWVLFSKYGNADFFNFNPKGSVHVDPEIGRIHEEDIYKKFLADVGRVLLFLPFNLLLYPIRLVVTWLLCRAVDKKLYRARDYAFQSEWRVVLVWLGSIWALVRICMKGLPHRESSTLTKLEIFSPFLSFIAISVMETIRKQRRDVTFFVNHMRHDLCLATNKVDAPIDTENNSEAHIDMQIDGCALKGLAHIARGLWANGSRLADRPPTLGQKTSSLDKESFQVFLERLLWEDLRFQISAHGHSFTFEQYLESHGIHEETFVGADGEEHIQENIEVRRRIIGAMVEKVKARTWSPQSPCIVGDSIDGVASSIQSEADPLLSKGDNEVESKRRHEQVEADSAVDRLISLFHLRSSALNHILEVADQVKSENAQVKLKLSFPMVELIFCLAYSKHFRPDRSMTTATSITEFQCVPGHMFLAALALVHALIPRLWMWLKFTPDDPFFAVWPNEDWVSNVMIYTSIVCNAHAHWVITRYLFDAYQEMVHSNERLIILHRFVKDAPNFACLVSYNQIVKDGYSDSPEVHQEQDIRLRWTIGDGGTKEFKPPFQVRLHKAKEVHLWWEVRKSFIIYFINDRIYLELFMGSTVLVGALLAWSMAWFYFSYNGLLMAVVVQAVW